MKNGVIIRSDGDVEAFRQSMQDESGMTDAEWWQKTDPNNPPLKTGDKVWIDNVAGGVHGDMIPKIREPQTVDKVIPVPCSDGPLWSVYLVDIPYLFTQCDLRKV